MSGWGWWLKFLTKSDARGAYRDGAYKKRVLPTEIPNNFSLKNLSIAVVKNFLSQNLGREEFDFLEKY